MPRGGHHSEVVASLKTDDTGHHAGRPSSTDSAQACPGYLPPGTSATGGARKMVLAYMDFRSELGFARALRTTRSCTSWSLVDHYTDAACTDLANVSF